MLDRNEELEAFKRRINLSEYAASCGYLLDRKASSRNSAVMRHSNGDKVVVAIDRDSHWIYFSVRDDADNGSIIDFMQRRKGGSLGEVRTELRPFLEGTHFAASPNADAFASALEPASKDLLRVRARFEAMSPIVGHHVYLENERRIPADVLCHPRFRGRIRIDAHKNAIFPHWNLSGLSGFETKNHNFTALRLAAEKGLWASHGAPDDAALVIAETAIDALSHFALKRPQRTRYVSTAGALNPSQPELIRHAAEKLPHGKRLILATDNDAGGDLLVRFIRDFLAL